MAEKVECLGVKEEAKRCLQAMSNRVFDALAADVFDELDRREVNEICLNHQSNQRLEKVAVSALPESSCYSSTRNEGRQKLSRFSQREFSALVIDVLVEAKKRQQLSPLSSNCRIRIKQQSSLDKCLTKNENNGELNDNKECVNGDTSDEDSEPLYDSVASDEDNCVGGKRKTMKQLHYVDDTKKAGSHIVNSRRIDTIKPANGLSVLPAEYDVLKMQLMKSDNLIQELVTSNKDMRQEITRLQVMVEKLIDENKQLRQVIVPLAGSNSLEFPTEHDQISTEPPPAVLPRASTSKTSNRAQSMYEVRPIRCKAPPPPPNSSLKSRDDSGIKPSMESSHEVNHVASSESANTVARLTSSSPNLSSTRKMSDETKLPSKDNVFKKTEKITKRIHELLVVAQEDRIDMLNHCSEKIHEAIEEMCDLFPTAKLHVVRGSTEESIFISLHDLKSCAFKLAVECKAGSNQVSLPSSSSSSPSSPTNHGNRLLIQQVIERAYNTAKTAKQLVSHFQ